MKTSVLAGVSGCAALIVLGQSAMALDLTPRESEKILEGGVRVPTLRFSDDLRTIRYTPPAGWKWVGGATSITLLPREGAGTSAKISITPRKPGMGTLAEFPSGEFERWVRSLIPTEAMNVELRQVLESPFLLGTAPTREYQFDYTVASRVVSRTIIAAELGANRLVVDLIAARGEFATAREAIVSSFFSWAWE